MKKTLIVAKREYKAVVHRKGFIIATVAFPLMLVALYSIIGLVTVSTLNQTRAKKERMGVVDESSLLRFEWFGRLEEATAPLPAGLEKLPEGARSQAAGALARTQGPVEFVPFRSREEAKGAYLKGEIRGYYILPADFVDNGRVELELRKAGFGSDSSPGWAALRRVITASLVDGRIDAQLVRRVWTPATLTTRTLDEAGKPGVGGRYAEVASFAVPYIFALFFMISILGSSGYLMQGVSEEKENRVIEILLSSVKPEELLAGKILGLGAAGLTQIAVWAAIGFAPALYVLPYIELRWQQLAVAVVYFPLGFLLFGSLMGGTASLGNNLRESQQMSMIWTMASIIPMFFMTAVIAQPNGTVARVLSFIPFTAPVTMMMRVAAVRVAAWEVAVSILILAGSLFLFIRLAAKLFRLGTLMYGKRPSVVEVVRWLRAS